jgi:hypothetical protein
VLIKDLYYVLTLPIRILKEITFDVYLLSDKKTKNIIYITSPSVGKVPYFIERICGNDASITKIKRIYIWELRKFVEDQDAVLVDMYRLFARFFDRGFFVPEFVRQVLDIDKPLNDVIKLRDRELKKVHKYSYEISNDPDTLKFFYEKMYVHHIKIKYGDLAVDNFDNIRKIFKNGELVFVTLDGKRVSAYLNEMSGDTYILRRNGILDDSFAKEGAMVAAYYFSILRAKERDAKAVDFGGSKPFLLDGVLRHKNQWGTKICISKTAQRIIYLKNVLFEQPFIYIDGEELKIAIFSEDDKLIKEYSGSGLEFVKVDRKTERKAGL